MRKSQVLRIECAARCRRCSTGHFSVSDWPGGSRPASRIGARSWRLSFGVFVRISLRDSPCQYSTATHRILYPYQRSHPVEAALPDFVRDWEFAVAMMAPIRQFNSADASRGAVLGCAHSERQRDPRSNLRRADAAKLRRWPRRGFARACGGAGGRQSRLETLREQQDRGVREAGALRAFRSRRRPRLRPPNCWRSWTI